MSNDQLENQLNSFDAAQRSEALRQLKAKESAPAGSDGNVNMHFHSFFSYNAQGWSPTKIAWQSHKVGLYAAGLCDFDVLDGQDEFLDAAELLGLRATVNIETRAFLKEFADKEITSPGEPGVTYVMGAGFATDIKAGSKQVETLSFYRQKAGDRNESLIDRINPHLGDIAIDYEKDVLPLTPTDSATERHIISAYLNKSIAVHKDQKQLVDCWSGLLNVDVNKAEELLKDRPTLEGEIRNKLAKRGGVGYVQPSEDTFPIIDDFINWVLSCDAIPMITWVDGMSDGEAEPRAMLECMASKGAAALNIIPDRNWNFADAETSKIKQQKLKEMVEAAEKMYVPINIGTEMNKLGLPFADDLTSDALKPYKDIFVKGAQIMVGHSILLRYAGFSYTGEKAHAQFGGDAKVKNEFFASVGALAPLTFDIADKLKGSGQQKALDLIIDSSKKASWSV